MKQILITIPEPCHENWNNMGPVEKGRFCGSCSKQVVDFSMMNDGEMAAYLSSTNGKVCGRFNESQLNRTITKRQLRTNFLNQVWKLLLPGFFFSVKAMAQKTNQADKVPQDGIVRTNPKPMILGMVVKKITHDDFLEKNKIITGIVTDEETGKPVTGVSITLKGSNWGKVTDEDGSFAFNISKQNFSGVIIVSGAGYIAEELTVKELIQADTDKKTIRLKRKVTVLEEITLTTTAEKLIKLRLGGINVVNKRTLLQEIKDSISYTNQVKIYPNPVIPGGNCAIEISGVKKGGFMAQVIDINGKLIQQSQFYVPGEKYLFYLDLNAEVISGVYFIRIINAENNLIYNSRIVVQ
jgi:CarboxypepD_reg-like domain